MDPVEPPAKALWPTLLQAGLLLVVLLGAGVGTAWWLARHARQRVVRILLVTPAPGPGSGLDASEGRALGALVQDHLECYGRASVTSVTEMPTDLAPLLRYPDSRVVILDPRRQGDALALGFRTAEAGRLAQPGGSAWVNTPPVFRAPKEAFGVLDRALGCVPEAPGDALTPQGAGAFWDLIRASSLRLQNDHLREAVQLAEHVVQLEPGCATGWVLLGNLEYRRYLNNPQASRPGQAQVEALFQKALALVPGHPRAAFLLSLVESDAGDQRRALTLLIGARKRQPWNPTLLTGLAYAARGAGLLTLSRRALDLRDSLAFSSYLPQAVDITRLYTGQIARFTADLQDRPGHLRNTTGIVAFYRGYLALVQGDRAAALPAFQEALEAPRGYPSIVRLAEVYVLILEGRTQEAWEKLHALDQARVGMREPDGEFTLRLAEAYALLGDRASAMDMAVRSFGRGFGCTEWYERSPMLQPLRALPRWQALIQHLRERQGLMESTFPASLVEDPS
jgi:tetratricopeptide (TPR) repeat protein